MGTRRSDSSLRRTNPGGRRDPWSSSESSKSLVLHPKSLRGTKSFWCGSETLIDTVGAAGERLPASVDQGDHDFKSCRSAAAAKRHLRLPQERQRAVVKELPRERVIFASQGQGEGKCRGKAKDHGQNGASSELVPRVGRCGHLQIVGRHRIHSSPPALPRQTCRLSVDP